MSSDPDAVLATVIERVSNWGRWGPDDQAGTVNYITDGKRIEAAGAVRSGEMHSLALPISPDYPQASGSGRPKTYHEMIGLSDDYADDAISMAVHGSTHWDALSHVFHMGHMYNGYPASEYVSEAGARRNAMTAVASRVVTRGILLDLAAAQGVGALETDYEITSEDLDRCVEREHIEVRSGDALLIRTGHLGRIQRLGAWDEFTASHGLNPLEPGIGLDALGWIHEREVAAVASDNWAVEVIRSRDMANLPVHIAAIVHMGLLLGEVFQLDALATACAADSRYEFLLAATPLPIEGAVGGPVHPIAIR
jgi:kynurenine formamidase